MNKVLLFNYCSIPIYLIILFTTFVRRTTHGRVNRLFIWLISISLFTNLVDLIADGYEAFLPLTSPGRLLVSCANYAYFLARNLIPPLYMCFLLALTKTKFRLKTILSKILFSMPYFVVVVILLTNPIHQKAFTVTAEEGYIRGPLLLLFYGISLSYSLLGTGYLIYCFRFLKFGKWFPLISMYLLSFTGILIQLFFPKILIEIYASAAAFLLIILMVLRPEEITDQNVGLPNWKAYQNELYKIIRIKRPVQICVLRFINATQVRDYLGEERFNAYITKTANVFEGVAKKYKFQMDLFYEAPGLMYFIIDADTVSQDFFEKKYDEIVAEMRYATKDVETTGVYLRGRVCTIFHPRDFSDEKSIIQMGHSFHEFLSDGQHCIRAADLVGTRLYEVKANMSHILNRAIRNKDFELRYQPIYDLQQNRFRSCEALVRLTDPVFGNIDPSLFVQTAEKNGSITSIGNFILDSVYKFISEHDLSSLGLDYIEVNLSVAQCLQTHLADMIIALQMKYNVSPSSINFEITETTYNDIGNIAQNNIKKLVAAGYTFSLDDYGTGYSNTRRMIRLPISLVKIDKSMVDEMQNEFGGSVLRDTIAMLKAVDKKVLAEGIESEEQLSVLKEMGCDYIQGYYFSKPLLEKEFVNFLEEKNKLV